MSAQSPIHTAVLTSIHTTISVDFELIKKILSAVLTSFIREEFVDSSCIFDFFDFAQDGFPLCKSKLLRVPSYIEFLVLVPF